MRTTNWIRSEGEAIKTYASFFSGVGGLEASRPAASFCELDPKARAVLALRFPHVRIYEDIRDVQGVTCDVIAGGWPCQDISVAGNGKGLKGPNSGLFYELLRVAVQSNVESVVAENVANVLRLENGKIFRIIVREFFDAGFTNIAWRSINAREFGLPHHRNRIFFVASRDPLAAKSLFRSTPKSDSSRQRIQVAGFYWTAGTHSINYSKGYVPTIKVGSALSIPSPPAIHFEDVVRMLSPAEAMRLQGLAPIDAPGLTKGDIYRMAGNAVAAPVGRWVLDGVLEKPEVTAMVSSSQAALFGDSFLDEEGTVIKAGFYDGSLTAVLLERGQLARNLSDFIDLADRSTISSRAAAGLLKRINRNDTPCPDPLRGDLERLARS